MNTTQDAPRAEQETFETPRDQVVNPQALTPELLVSPPSPAGSDRERPRSEVYGQGHAPALPAKRSIGHAASEMSLVTGASEEKGELPNIPPKLKPFIPPKQTINKSREDVHKINKENS